MPLVDLREIESILACPRCRTPLAREETCFRCTDPDCVFAGERRLPIVDDHPILVDLEHSILGASTDLLKPGAQKREPPPGGLQGVMRRLQHRAFGHNPVALQNTAYLRELLQDRENATILVIGGGTVGAGVRALYDDPALRIIGFDIYRSPVVQFVADGHRIPLRDQSVDAVLIQAVLEHVLDPWQVVSEIRRVLVPEGIVYSEVPFMQQVHEGAYDFTRFSHSGHRWLFRHFEEIRSSVGRGHGMQLIWSIDYLVRGLTRSRKAANLAILMLFWLKYLDRFIAEPDKVDNAAGSYFMGRLSPAPISPLEMVPYYRGRQCALRRDEKALRISQAATPGTRTT